MKKNGPKVRKSYKGYPGETIYLKLSVMPLFKQTLREAPNSVISSSMLRANKQTVPIRLRGALFTAS